METKPAIDQQYLSLMQKLVELQMDNIALQKEELCDQLNMSHFRKPEQPTIRLNETDGNRPMFINTWTHYRDG